ncbi:MAG: hypothetical protein JW798_07790 [Prolixibacteraceae bacterium]|nr:hypothetical protein [Prolixibacteraceae bacterium]
MHATLSEPPELIDNYLIKIKVENSVQFERIRSLKPEMIGFLRRSLKNSRIDIKIDLVKNHTESKLLTDEQKLQAMMQKNPALKKMKTMFNLDF